MTPDTPVQTMVQVGLFLLEWIGMSSAILIAGGRLYSRAVYDAWGEANVDTRIFWGGCIAGVGGSWFLMAPYVLMAKP